MTETVVNFFIELFPGLANHGIGKYITISVLSMMPVVELRGGLIAAALVDLPLLSSFIVCYIFNLLPIPFILMLITWIFDKLRDTKSLGKIVRKLENKANSKKASIEKYGYWGLFSFVAIPLPGTGAWTGALIASMLKMNKKKSFLTIALGVLGAGIIMTILSYGILKGIFN